MMLYFVLIGVPLLLGLWAQIRVKSAFSRYSKVQAGSNVTGAEAARKSFCRPDS